MTQDHLEIAGELDGLAAWFAAAVREGRAIELPPANSAAFAHAFQAAAAVLRGELTYPQALAPAVVAGGVVRVDFTASRCHGAVAPQLHGGAA